ncbi:MAG: hypothetical protein U0791_20775 [Gemmataceae bacterium]
MFRPIASSVRQPAPRRGALLIAVLGLLTLFAIFALFFVFYADAEATSSRIHREAQSPGDDALDGTPAFNYTLSCIIFDDTDFNTGVQNALRGHSLARSMYGGLQGNSAPFSGIGTFHENAPNGQDRATWINFAAPYTPVAPYIHSAGPNTAFLDPEFSGFRTGQQVAANQLPGSLSHAFIPKNAPYTYPDLKDLILASVSPATGEVLVPSLHRNWLFNAGNPNPNLRLAPWNPDDPNLAANTDWVTPEGRTRILRPRPIDQMRPGEYPAGLYPVPPGMGGWTAGQKTQLYLAINSLIASGQIIGYPKPNAPDPALGPTFTGDVQNLTGGVGVQKNDSILVDIGLPPRLWNGRWIKPLASILLTDLDGLLNLNAHGNLRGPGTPGSHGSHAGFGPNEVNLGMVLSTPEAANIVQARYGIPSWSPNTPYSLGARVMNYGNFYVCVGPMGGGMSGATGPIGNYPTGSPFADGSVQWENLQISLPRNGQSTLQFDRSGTRLPNSAPVNFDGGGSNPLINYPSFTSTPPTPFQTNTTYANGGQGFFDDNAGGLSNYNKYLNHPLLWNPNDWPSGVASRRAYPLADTKRFNLRYAADRNWYTETDVWRAQTANASLIGQGPPYTGGSYRLDPAHANRMLVTTLSTSLDLPYLPANFETSNAGTLLLPPPPGPGQPQPLHPINAAFTGTFPGTISGANDFTGPANLRNQRAALGPVDLNRPLADYRTDPNVPLGQPSTTTPADTLNSGNYAQAWADRHNLARDIFARLIISTGANATVDASGNVTIVATPGNPDYNALRYLAQLAANAVDLVDSDDVSTVFAWDLGAPLTQVDATSVSLAATAAAGRTPTGLVFGVEKPRLVINEAYGEITNDPNEVLPNNAPANNNFRVRFWVELMNPTATPYAAGTGPLGNGGVAVHNGTFNPYQLVVTQVNAANNTALYSDPTNVAGNIAFPNVNGAQAGFTFDFSPAAGNAALRNVLPVNGAYAPANGSPGFVMVGAADFTNQHSSGGSTVEFRPNANPPFNTQMITGNVNVGAMVTNAMEYDFGSKPGAAALENAGNMNPYRRHAVLLRRLANPYLAANPPANGVLNPALPYNPYVTVDLMDRVPAFDAVTRGGAAGDMTDRLPKAAAGITNAGFEPVDDTSGGTRRFSVGKVQPYAGAATASAVNNDVDLINSFPQSMVVRQSPAAANGSYPGNGNPLHTFFRQNGRNDAAPMAQTYNNAGLIGGETLMAPYDPFVHYDRLLVNQLELLSLQATKPHEVTQYTLRNNGGALVRNQGLAPWLGYNTTTNLPGFDATTNRTNNGLYRALESLRVKPWTYGMASGGKVHGKININTIQDPRVFRALLDARNGNYFTATEVDSMWTSMISSTAPTAGIPYRTWQTYNTATAAGTAMSVPLPGPSYDDLANPAGNFDRPFRSFGAPEFAASGTTAAYRNGGGIQDTLLRTWPVGTPLPGQPLAWSTNPNVMIPPPSPNPNSYADTGLQSEMLRKMINNTTTVSHAFAVTVTIVFHEVRLNGATPDTSVNEGPGPRYLIGREAFKDAPGDLRQQFYSIVDRANLVLDPNPSVAVPLASGIHMQPVSAALDQAIVIGSTAPTPPAMSGFQTPPTGSYNVYLTNRVPGTGQPFTLAGNFGGQVTVYADGKPYVISAGRVISIGVGTGRESQLIVNYVNQDGSLNIGDPSNQLGFGVRAAPSMPHAAGELVSNFVTGNPGPVNPGNASNPGPFEVLHPPANSPYTAVVPFAQRVR